MDVDEAEVLDHLQIIFVDFKNPYYKSDIDNVNQIIEYHNLSEKVISEWYYELADLRELSIEVERHIIKSINDLQNESELTPYLSTININYIFIMLILPSYISVSIFVDNPIILLDSRNGLIENMFQLINLFISQYFIIEFEINEMKVLRTKGFGQPYHDRNLENLENTAFLGISLKGKENIFFAEKPLQYYKGFSAIEFYKIFCFATFSYLYYIIKLLEGIQLAKILKGFKGKLRKWIKKQ